MKKELSPKQILAVLWQQQGGLDLDVIASPDGRHVAIQSELLNSNLWMMENF